MFLHLGGYGSFVADHVYYFSSWELRSRKQMRLPQIYFLGDREASFARFESGCLNLLRLKSRMHNSCLLHEFCEEYPAYSQVLKGYVELMVVEEHMNTRRWQILPVRMSLEPSCALVYNLRRVPSHSPPHLCLAWLMTPLIQIQTCHHRSPHPHHQALQ